VRRNLRPQQFSVIIPTYNRADLISHAIDSVLGQTCHGCEIIVVDDGSGDRTAEVVRHYVVEYPSIVHYLWQENRGKSVALNNAMARAKGEFVAFLDSDDRWLPGKLEWQLQAIHKFGVERPCFTDAYYVNNPSLQQTAFEFAEKHYSEEFGLVPEPCSLFFGGRSGIYIQTLIVRRALALRVGDFDSKLWVGNDTDYLFRLGLLTPFCYVNKPLVEIDRTETRTDGLIQQMVRNEPLRIGEREYLYCKWLNITHESSTQLRANIVASLAEAHNEWANWHLHNHEYGKAHKALAKSLMTQFTLKAGLKWLLVAIAPRVAREECVRRDLDRSKRRVTT